MNDQTLTPSLTVRLKEYTRPVHERLDHGIMAAGMFSDRVRYRDFVLLQYLFHRDIAALYDDLALARIVADLPDRNRFALIREDMADLEIPVPNGAPQPVADDSSGAIGWLYVAEGSKLGAGILARLAETMGLGASFGARHLRPDAAGRGRSWAAFQGAIDGAQLDPARSVAGAEQGFRRVIDYLGAVTAKQGESA